jgi:hypothetical protein
MFFIFNQQIKKSKKLDIFFSKFNKSSAITLSVIDGILMFLLIHLTTKSKKHAIHLVRLNIIEKCDFL